MSSEVHAKVETVSTNVTILQGYPLKLVGDSFHVQVYPTGNTVHVTDGTLNLIKPNIKIYIPGSVVKFNNSVTASSGWLEIGHWAVLYSFTETVIHSSRPLTITYDVDSGHFVASHPCHAAIKIEPFFAYYDLYSYTPAFGKEVTTFDPWLGKEYKMSATFYGTAYCIKWFDPVLQLPPVVATFDIPAPNILPSTSTNLYNTYSITTPTILTSRGEYIRPSTWNSPDYDSANAYGPGKEGPSKDDAWVMKHSVLETGHVNADGDAIFHRNAIPAVIASDIVPASDLEKYVSVSPANPLLSPAANAAGQSAAANRASVWGASPLPNPLIAGSGV